MRRYPTKVLLGVGAAMLATALVGWLWYTEFAPRRGPQNIQQAVAIAEELGFFWGTDERDGVPVYFLVISETPVSRERAGDLRVNDPRHPGWLATVRLYRPWQSMLPNYDPACSAIWGEFFIYGDPRLIRKLTGQRLCAHNGVATTTFRPKSWEPYAPSGGTR